jgi:hypothetical protein
MSLVACQISRCVPVSYAKDIPRSMKVLSDLKNVEIVNNAILNGLVESILMYDISRVFWVSGMPYKFKLVHVGTRYATFIQMCLKYDVTTASFKIVTVRKVKLMFA